MTKIKIKDLPLAKSLDAKTLRKVRGGGGRFTVGGQIGYLTIKSDLKRNGRKRTGS